MAKLAKMVNRIAESQFFWALHLFIRKCRSPQLIRSLEGLELNLTVTVDFNLNYLGSGSMIGVQIGRVILLKFDSYYWLSGLNWKCDIMRIYARRNHRTLQRLRKKIWNFFQVDNVQVKWESCVNGNKLNQMNYWRTQAAEKWREETFWKAYRPKTVS